MKKAVLLSTALAIASCTNAHDLDKLKPSPDYYYGGNFRGPSPESVCSGTKTRTVFLSSNVKYAKIMHGKLKIAEILSSSEQEPQHIYIKDRGIDLYLTNGSYILIDGYEKGKKIYEVAVVIACNSKSAAILLNNKLENLTIDVNDLGEENDRVEEIKAKPQAYMGKLEYVPDSNFYASDTQKICNAQVNGDIIYSYNGADLTKRVHIDYKKRRVGTIIFHPEEKYFVPKQRLTIDYSSKNKHRYMDIVLHHGEYVLITDSDRSIVAIISCGSDKVVIVVNSELKGIAVSTVTSKRNKQKTL